MHKRRRTRFITMAFSLLSVLMMLLSACAQGTPVTNQGGGNPVKGGTWIDDLFEEPDSLIPNASNETFAAMVDFALYAPLFYGDEKGAVHEGIATTVPTLTNGGISQDLKTWTIHLKSGLTWSDGQPLNADDVDFTWKLWNDPKFGAINNLATQEIDSADVSADKLTITFHLKHAFAPFVSYWIDGYFAPMPKHHFANMAPDQIKKSADNLNPAVVSGPFMMSESKAGDHYTLARNPKYYQAAQGLPYLDKVVFRIVSDQNTILKDLQAGTINSSWFLDVAKTSAYQKLKDYTLVADPNSTNFEGLWFDFHNKTLADNIEVRQAIAMAVDQTALIDTARRGVGGKLCTDHPASIKPGYQPDAPCPKFDIDAANKLLDSHGWTKGADGVRSKGGQRLEFQYSTTAGNLWRSEDQLINQTNFKAIGIKVNIQNYPASTLFGTFLTDGKPGTYDIVEYATGLSYDPDDSSFLACSQIPPKGSSNTTFYCNPDLDKLYEQERATADPAARQEVFNKIHQIYLTEYPFVVLFSAPFVAMVKHGGHNYAPSPVGVGETENIWMWWCDGGKC